MIYWIFLILAIVTEVIGTLAMQYANKSGSLLGLPIMYIFIAISYILLALSVKRIALGVAYALWEGVGIVIITLVSVWIFHETLTLLKIIGITILIISIFLLKNGTTQTERQVKYVK